MEKRLIKVHSGPPVFDHKVAIEFMVDHLSEMLHEACERTKTDMDWFVTNHGPLVIDLLKRTMKQQVLAGTDNGGIEVGNIEDLTITPGMVSQTLIATHFTHILFEKMVEAQAKS